MGFKWYLVPSESNFGMQTWLYAGTSEYLAVPRADFENLQKFSKSALGKNLTSADNPQGRTDKWENKMSQYAIQIDVTMDDGTTHGPIPAFVEASSYEEAVEKAPGVADKMTQIDKGRTNWTYKVREVVKPIEAGGYQVHVL